MEATRDYQIDYDGAVYFASHELACKATGLILLGPAFHGHALSLRLAYDTGMGVLCCCRSWAHNRSPSVKGHKRSLHVYDKPYKPTGARARAGRIQAQGTEAWDIRMPADPLDGVRLVRIGLEKGWSIGTYSWGFHMDRRVDLGMPQRIFPGK